jgi:thiamine pyrophosphokinase
MRDEVVVVVAGGEPPVSDAGLALPPDAPVIAADGGLAHALALGLDVALVVGDLDSASPVHVREAEELGARIEQHPEAKDATDLELALDAALERGPARIVIVAGDGGRLDHLLGNLLLLASDKYADVEVDAALGTARLHVVRRERTLEGSPGDLLSLVPLHAPAEGVRTHGLLYPLVDETLEAGSSRGISNVFAESSARVSLERGVLLAIRPGSEGA